MSFNALNLSNFDPDVDFDAEADESFDQQQVPEGYYAVTGIKRFISKDDQGDPATVASSFRPAQEVRVELSTAEGVNIPASLTHEECILFASYFGRVEDLPSHFSTRFLLEWESLVNEGQGNVTAKVGTKGWVTTIFMLPPFGKYAVQFVGFFPRREGKPYLGTGKYGSYVGVNLRIAEGPFEGAEIATTFNSPFTGNAVRTEAGLQPALKKSKNGAARKDTRRWFALLNAFATSSNPPTVPEENLANPLPFYERFLSNERVAKIYVQVTDGNRKFDVVDMTRNAEGADSVFDKGEVNYLETLKNVLNELAGFELFKGTTGYTDEGKEWLGINVKPICVEYGIPPNVYRMSDEEKETILQHLEQLATEDEEDVYESF